MDTNSTIVLTEPVGTLENGNYPRGVTKRNYLITLAVKLTFFALTQAYFIWASIYFANHDEIFSDSTCSGFGFLVILNGLVYVGLCYNFVVKPFVNPLVGKFLYRPVIGRVTKIKHVGIYFNVAIFAAILGYLIYDTGDDRTRLIPLAGLCLYLAIGFGISSNRSKIPWHTVTWGLILQFGFGLLTIRWDTGRNVFDCLGQKVTTFLGYAQNGSAFVYSDQLVLEGDGVFAFKALATIYFLGFMINILYYYGIMQKVVTVLGDFLSWAMNTSVCESVNSAANIFLGMSEAPLLLKPYLTHLTDSEVHSVMTSGFATVSGTVLAAYISFGADPAHLITASVMSAPAALCYSKLSYPETEEIKATSESIKAIKVEYQSVLDAASQGAADATNIVLGIIASLVAFIAFIFFVNGMLSWFGDLVGLVDPPITVELIVGKIFIPISFIMGVPWDECELVGRLIGIKTMVNEFAAFAAMGQMDLTPKSKVIATYSICGFSNPGSVGIMISCLGGLMPNKRETITRLVGRAFLGGVFVCFMTACIAAMLIPSTIYPPTSNSTTLL